MADAINTDDSRETKAMDDSTTTDTTATDTDTDTEVSDDDLNPTDDDQPEGAKALTTLYDWLMEGQERVGGAQKRQENPDVAKLLSQWDDTISQYLDEVAKTFSELYPDLPPLADQHQEEDETDEEAVEEGTADEGDAEQSGMKRKRAAERAAKRLESWKAKRLESVRKNVLARIKIKRMSRAAKSAIGDAADHLDEMGGHSGEMTKSLKTASKYHAGELRKLCKAEEVEETKADDSQDESEETTTKSLTPAQVKAAALPLAEELAEKKIKEIKARLDQEVATMKKTHEKILKEFKAARTGR